MTNLYSSIEKLKSDTGKRYYKNIVYPEIDYSDNDIYLITTIGDRLDLLAYDYYKDISLWKFIAAANALSGDSLYLTPGSQIRIPANVNGVISNFKLINSGK